MLFFLLEFEIKPFLGETTFELSNEARLLDSIMSCFLPLRTDSIFCKSDKMICVL